MILVELRFTASIASNIDLSDHCFLLLGVLVATSTAGADFEHGLPRFFLVLCSIPVQNHKESSITCCLKTHQTFCSHLEACKNKFREFTIIYAYYTRLRYCR